MNASIFLQFEQSYGGRRAAGLLAKHQTDMRWMFSEMFSVARAAMSRLTPGRRYTAADICGPDLWSVWCFKGQKYAAGMCMKFLVKVGALQLELHKTKSGRGTTTYYVPMKG